MSYIKNLFAIVLIGLLFLNLNLSSFAQETIRGNTVVTSVGNPTEPKPGAVDGGGENTSGECGKGGLREILCWTNKIKPKIEQSQWVEADGRRYYNKMTTSISDGAYSTPIRNATVRDGATSPTGIYWCTNLVIDTYTLAGIPGLSIGASDQSVAVMSQHFNSKPNLKFLTSGNNSIQNYAGEIRPGFAMMQGGAHVAIVKSIKVDANGNGSIVTIDSNTPAQGDLSFPVTGFRVLNLWGGPVGFGGPR